MITVKPLEWKQTVIGDGTVLRQNAWLASHYQIIESPSGKYDLRGDTYAICDTLEEAQVAAFADYSARIMSAIEPAGVGVETMEDIHRDQLARDRLKPTGGSMTEYEREANKREAARIVRALRGATHD